MGTRQGTGRFPSPRRSNPTIDLSLNDSDVELLPPRPSRVRSFSTKLLFFTIFFAAVVLLSYEASIRFHIASLDPRTWIVQAKAVLQRVGLEKLQKLLP